MTEAVMKVAVLTTLADLADIENEDTAAPPFSEEFLALRFAERHGGSWRFIAKFGKWRSFNGTVWKDDDSREVYSLARKLCREIAGAVNERKESKTIASAKVRAAVVALAGEDRRIAATFDIWDRDPWLLNTPSGTIDLKTGALRPHRAEDYLTKITAVVPDVNCPTPLWNDFLATVTADNGELQKFLARVCGYALTGMTNEHALFFCYGTGGNGKGVFLSVLGGILGQYARSAPIEVFTVSVGERHPTEVAMLHNARLVTATETEEGRRWAESRIKALTGGDTISARFKRQDFFEFVPRFKLIISGNHKPGLRSVDEAIRRRFHLLPFDVTITDDKKDINLGEKLKAEWPGILSWMIAGCLEWQRIGLAPPAVVTEATDKYLQAEDAFTRWFDDCCTLVPGQWTSSALLYQKWTDWAKANGEYPVSQKRLGQRLEAVSGVTSSRVDGRGYEGLTTFKVIDGRVTQEAKWTVFGF